MQTTCQTLIPFVKSDTSIRIAENVPSIVGQPIHESARLESGDVDCSERAPSRRPASLDIALIAQVARVTLAGRVDRRH
jgi:hypothetical protein